MSIDVSDLISLFSSVSGLEGLQLTDIGKAGTGEGFSDALMEQVKLLQEQGALPKDLEGLNGLQDLLGEKEVGKLQEFIGVKETGKFQDLVGVQGAGKLQGLIGAKETGKIQDLIGADGIGKLQKYVGTQGTGKLQELIGAKGSEKLQILGAVKETGQLQEFAGLLNDYGKTKEPVRETGNKLPLLSELENNIKIKDINIEETVETLQTVMQHISAATEFVEEKVAEVAEVIEQAVAFLQGDNVGEEPLDLQEKITTPLVSTQLETASDDIGQAVEPATNTLVKEALTEEELALLTSVIQEQTVISNTVVDQTNIQQVFSKEFEKATPINSAPTNPVASTTGPNDVVEAVGDTEQEFLDDMLNKDQSMFKPGQETSILDKHKQAEFDLNALSATNNVEKPGTNYAADISLLNRQMQSVGTETKVQAPPMTQPFNHPEWKNEFSERIVWMHNKSLQAAELRLNPQNLGPISIRINISQDQATIAFTAQHASVREAIEAAIPRLREMLNGQQINLAEVNVSQQDLSEQRNPQGFFQNGQKQDNQQGSKFSMDGNNAENIENTLELTEEIERGRAVASNGILNIYA